MSKQTTTAPASPAQPQNRDGAPPTAPAGPGTNQPPVTPEAPATDYWTSTILADLGKAISDPPKSSAEKKDSQNSPTGDGTKTATAPEMQPISNDRLVTLGDAARYKQEREELERASKPAVEAPEKNKDAPPKDATPPKPDDTKPTEKPKISVTVEPAIEDVVKKVISSVPAAVAPKLPPDPAQAPAEDYENGLGEAERDRLETARFAAKMDPKRYADMPEKWLKYFKSIDDYYDKHGADDGRTFDESDEEFMEFVAKNQPNYDPGEERRIERARIREEAKAEILPEISKQVGRVEARQREIELQPAITETVDLAVNRGISALASVPKEIQVEDMKEISSTIAADGMQKAQESWPIEAPIIQRNMQALRSYSDAFMRLASGLSDYDGSNAAHKFLADFINAQCAYFDQNGGNAKIRVSNGVSQTFVPRNQFMTMTPQDAANHWTLSDADVLEMLAISAAQASNVQVKAERERLEKAGYSRRKDGKNTKRETPPPVPSESPRAGSSMAPGAAEGGKTVKPPSLMSDEELAVLGVPVK